MAGAQVKGSYESIQKQLLQALKTRPYPFLKKEEHFLKGTPFNIPDGRAHHSAMECKKTPKASGSQKRNEADWIKIKTIVLRPETKRRAMAMIMAAGEMYRMDNPMCPKYRLLEEEKEVKLVSKKLENAEEFYTYSEREITPHIHVFHPPAGKRVVSYKDKHFLPGMGRAVVMNWFYAEDDFSSSNAYVVTQNDQRYFVPIDRDHVFNPLMFKFHKEGDWALDKYIGYHPGHGDLVPLGGQLTGFYKVRGMKPHEMGPMTLRDYERLPRLYDQLSRNWWFMEDDIPEYSQELSESIGFIYEKQFTALKLMTTFFLKSFLADYHVEDKEDNEPLQKWLSERHQKLKEICAQSSSFKKYLHEFGTSAFSLVLYETFLFFEENKHYVPKGKNAWHEIWKDITAQLIKEFDEISTLCGMEKMTSEEREALERLSEACENHSEDIYPFVIQCYDYHEMAFEAMQAGLRSKEPVKKAAEEVKDEGLDSIYTLFPRGEASDEARPGDLFEDRPHKKKGLGSSCCVVM